MSCASFVSSFTKSLQKFKSLYLSTGAPCIYYDPPFQYVFIVLIINTKWYGNVNNSSFDKYKYMYTSHLKMSNIIVVLRPPIILSSSFMIYIFVYVMPDDFLL